MSTDDAAASRQGLTLDTADVLQMPSGTAVRVVAGTVLVFVVPRTNAGPGRRIPVCQVAGPGVVAGADLPEADLIAVGLPGTQVVRADGQTDPQAHEEMANAAAAALANDQARRFSAADVQSLSAHHDERLIDDALLGLASAVPGEKPDLLSSGDLPADVAVIDFLARQIGLRPNQLGLRRAVADIDITGRDTVTALAAASGAAIRRVELMPSWWRKEGPPLLLQDSATGAYGATVWRRGAFRVWQPEHGLGPA
ncbi:MAG: hypothetical protein WCP28_20310, partial [Actinomycetes bacterium]